MLRPQSISDLPNRDCFGRKFDGTIVDADDENWRGRSLTANKTRELSANRGIRTYSGQLASEHKIARETIGESKDGQ